MSILIDDGSRVLVQGITGREGQFHTERMIRYGTRVVGGVTPGRGGQGPTSVWRSCPRRWRRTRPVKRRRRASGSWWSSPSMSPFWIWCG